MESLKLINSNLIEKNEKEIFKASKINAIYSDFFCYNEEAEKKLLSSVRKYYF